MKPVSDHQFVQSALQSHNIHLAVVVFETDFYSMLSYLMLVGRDKCCCWTGVILFLWTKIYIKKAKSRET